MVKNIPGCTSRTSENNSSSSEIPYWHGLISPHALDAYERKQTSHIPLYIYIEKNRCAIVVLFPIMCTLPFNTRILFPPLPGLNNQLLMLTSWHFRFVFICFVFYSEQRNSLFSDTVFRRHRFVFAFPQFSARHALKKCFVFITDSPPYCWLFSYRDAHRGRARDAEMERSGMRLDGCGWTFRKKGKNSRGSSVCLSIPFCAALTREQYGREKCSALWICVQVDDMWTFFCFSSSDSMWYFLIMVWFPESPISPFFTCIIREERKVSLQGGEITSLTVGPQDQESQTHTDSFQQLRRDSCQNVVLFVPRK